MVTLKAGQNLQGRVAEFDEHVGLGSISIVDKDFQDNALIPFHCVNISDGSRKIDQDAKVDFVVIWHPRGRFEASNINKV